jgi:hypothetical protein
MTEQANHHPLRDKAASLKLTRLAGSVGTHRSEIRDLCQDAERHNAVAHANLYAEVCAELAAAKRSVETAARLMDPDLTDVSDYEEGLS